MSKQNIAGMLAVLYGSAFVAAFNENIINVALVSIMAEYGVDTNTAQWLVTGYMVITTIVVTVTAFLSNRLNLRTLFFIASAFLVGGGVGCLIAPSFEVLLVFRLAQAIGTGIFIPVMMSTVLAVAPRKKLGTYLSIGSCMITFGPAFSPVISGLMVIWMGWRGVFLPAMVVMIVLAIASIFLVKNVSEPQKIKLDLLSIALSAVGLTAFVYGLSIITTNLMLSIIIILIGAAVIGLFALRQRHLENPLLDLSPMTNPRFSIACILVVVAMMTTFSMSVLLPLYFEGALFMTAFVSGALLLPPILVNAGTALIGGRIMDKRGAWPLLPAGFALITAGQAAICFVAPSMSWISVLVGSIVVYAGVGLIFSPSQTAGLQTLQPEQNPHGVAIVNTFVQMAACIGPSLFIGVLSSTASGATSAGAESNVAQAEGFAAAVAIAALIALVGFLVSFFYAHAAKRAANAQVADRGASASVANAGVSAAGHTLGGTQAAGTSGANESAGVAGAQVPANAAGAHALGHDTSVIAAQIPETSQHTVAGAQIAQTPFTTLQSSADLAISLVMKAPYLIHDDATVRDAMLMLIERRTSGLPIVNERNEIVGFITDGDILKTIGKQNTPTLDLATSLAVYRDMRTFDTRLTETLDANVMEIATTSLVSVTAQTSIDEVCSILSSKRIKKVPVLEGKRVVGTISRSDVVRALMGSFAESCEVSENNEGDGTRPNTEV